MHRALLGFLAALLLAPAAAGGEPQEGYMLHVQKVGDGTYRFIPAEVDVYAGSPVVLGHIFARHSLTSVDGRFNSTGDAGAWPAVVAPDEPGTYPFYCWLQGGADTNPGEGMAGALRVHARSGGEPGRASTDAPTTGPDAATRQPPAPVPGWDLGLMASAAALTALALRRR